MAILYIVAFCRIAIAIVFGLSSYSKLSNITSFIDAVARFDMLPKEYHRTAAWAFVTGEVLVVPLVLIGDRLLFCGFLLAIALLTCFCGVLALALIRQKAISCNCFGPSDKDISRFDIYRNLGFICCAVTGIILNQQQDTSISLHLLDWGTVVLAAGLFVILLIHLSDIRELLQLQ